MRHRIVLITGTVIILATISLGFTFSLMERNRAEKPNILIIIADVLRGKKNTHRQLVLTVHNNLPEGPRYPIRSVTDGHFHYIRNLADDPSCQEIKQKLSKVLDAWMADQNDPGEPVDTPEALEAGRKGKHLNGRV
jgi:hypothetical protein